MGLKERFFHYKASYLGKVATSPEWRNFMNLTSFLSTCQRIALGLMLLVGGPIFAFPPSPYYTLFGMVRDQSGQVLEVEGAQIVLLKGTMEISRAIITRDLVLDSNYELNIRLDATRIGTTSYTEAAITSLGTFNLAVEINQVRYYPIEARGSFTAGKGAERVRLDLNLGIDSDSDGLPDAWEMLQLYNAGSDINQLNLLSRNDDFDNDGKSNWEEYIAGTYATDRTDVLSLKIKEFLELTQQARMEFYGITSKTYTLEKTSDLKNWTRAAFSTTQTGATDTLFRAPQPGIYSIFVSAPLTSEFYRLIVR